MLPSSLCFTPLSISYHLHHTLNHLLAWYSLFQVSSEQCEYSLLAYTGPKAQQVLRVIPNGPPPSFHTHSAYPQPGISFHPPLFSTFFSIRSANVLRSQVTMADFAPQGAPGGATNPGMNGSGDPNFASAQPSITPSNEAAKTLW